MSDVAITFAGLIFGPWVGMVAGGVGTALADLIGRLHLSRHLAWSRTAMEGFLIGLVGGVRRSVGGMAIAWLAGSVAMVSVYLVGEDSSCSTPAWAPALAELPMNVFPGRWSVG